MQIVQILVFIALSMVHSEAAMSCKQAQLKVKKKGNCELGPGEKPQQCYNFCTLAPITMKDCEKKVNAHCCKYEGKCIMKGGVTIPTDFTTTPKTTTTPEPTTTATLSCKDVKLQLKAAKCMPQKMYEDKVQGCYDICSKKLVKSLKQCSLKKNSHCCVYKGKCILKGAGIEAEEIPPEHQLTPPTTTTTSPATTTTKDETCLKARFRIKKAECAPDKEEDMQDCYDLCTKKPVDPKDCNLKKNSHCCLHNCRCIIKGAGTEEGELPAHLQLESPKKKFLHKPKLLPGCKPKLKPKPTPTAKPKTKKPSKTPKPTKKTPSTKKTKKPKKKKPKMKKPKTKKPKTKKPKPTSKKTKKPKTKPTPKTKKTKCPVTTTTAKPFSFSFFSKLSGILSGFGLESEVVPNNDC